MRTFVIRARKGPTKWDKVHSHIGGKAHIEVIAHSIMNAFFFSNGFRCDTEVYIILESTDDFPRTIKLSSNEGLSIAGFHEEAILTIIENALKNSQHLKINETLSVGAGIYISGFGFEKLMSSLMEHHSVYLLDRKGEDIRTIHFDPNPVFVLSDHLAMPKNIVKSLKRQGLKTISLGKKMLFASQCVVLINHELDRLSV